MKNVFLVVFNMFLQHFSHDGGHILRKLGLKLHFRAFLFSDGNMLFKKDCVCGVENTMGGPQASCSTPF